MQCHLNSNDQISGQCVSIHYLWSTTKHVGHSLMQTIFLPPPQNG